MKSTWRTARCHRPGTARPFRRPPACRNALLKVLHRDEKVDDVLDAVAPAVKTNGTLPATLTDQRGKVVRYEIRLNQPLFDYIAANGLFNGQNQVKHDRISFPDGSMLIKAAWRELDASEVPISEGRFLQRQGRSAASTVIRTLPRAVRISSFSIPPSPTAIGSGNGP